jgi:hypothetical protein
LAFRLISWCLVFVFLPEVGFTREGGRIYPTQPKGFVANRMATFFPGTKVAHLDGWKEAVGSLCPNTDT